MKRLLNVKGIVLLSLSILALAACFRQKTPSGESQSYTCPMHPEIKKPEAGTCPICKMDLVQVGQKDTATQAGSTKKYTCPMHPEVVSHKPGSCPKCKMDLELVLPAGTSDTLSQLQESAKGVDMGHIKLTSLLDTVIAMPDVVSGIIAYDPNSYRQVSARSSGRVEKLYIQYLYQPVSKGQKLMEIYSPEITVASQELLFLKAENQVLFLESAKRKLYLLGLSEAEVFALLRTGKVRNTVSIYSPVSGFVVESLPQSSPATPVATSRISSDAGNASMGGMGADAAQSTPAGTSSTVNKSLLIREGQYVSTGQKLFTVVNADRVWAQFSVSPRQAASLKSGDQVKVQQSGKQAYARINRVQPFYKDGANYVQVRAVVANNARLWKIGEQAEMVWMPQQKGRWLPRTALLSLGTKKVAFLKQGQALVPVYVEVRHTAGDYVLVGAGLAPKAEVAENAWFIVDSESFVNAETIDDHE